MWGTSVSLPSQGGSGGVEDDGDYSMDMALASATTPAWVDVASTSGGCALDREPRFADAGNTFAFYDVMQDFDTPLNPKIPDHPNREYANVFLQLTQEEVHSNHMFCNTLSEVEAAVAACARSVLLPSDKAPKTILESVKHALYLFAGSNAPRVNLLNVHSIEPRVMKFQEFLLQLTMRVNDIGLAAAVMESETDAGSLSTHAPAERVHDAVGDIMRDLDGNERRSRTNEGEDLSGCVRERVEAIKMQITIIMTVVIDAAAVLTSTFRYANSVHPDRVARVEPTELALKFLFFNESMSSELAALTKMLLMTLHRMGARQMGNMILVPVERNGIRLSAFKFLHTIEDFVRFQLSITFNTPQWVTLLNKPGRRKQLVDEITGHRTSLLPMFEPSQLAFTFGDGVVIDMLNRRIFFTSEQDPRVPVMRAAIAHANLALAHSLSSLAVTTWSASRDRQRETAAQRMAAELDSNVRRTGVQRPTWEAWLEMFPCSTALPPDFPSAAHLPLDLAGRALDEHWRTSVRMGMRVLRRLNSTAHGMQGQGCAADMEWSLQKVLGDRMNQVAMINEAAEALRRMVNIGVPPALVCARIIEDTFFLEDMLLSLLPHVSEDGNVEFCWGLTPHTEYLREILRFQNMDERHIDDFFFLMGRMGYPPRLVERGSGYQFGVMVRGEAGTAKSLICNLIRQFHEDEDGLVSLTGILDSHVQPIFGLAAALGKSTSQMNRALIIPELTDKITFGVSDSEMLRLLECAKLTCSMKFQQEQLVANPPPHLWIATNKTSFPYASKADNFPRRLLIVLFSNVVLRPDVTLENKIMRRFGSLMWALFSAYVAKCHGVIRDQGIWTEGVMHEAFHELRKLNARASDPVQAFFDDMFTTRVLTNDPLGVVSFRKMQELSSEWMRKMNGLKFKWSEVTPSSLKACGNITLVEKKGLDGALPPDMGPILDHLPSGKYFVGIQCTEDPSVSGITFGGVSSAVDLPLSLPVGAASAGDTSCQSFQPQQVGAADALLPTAGAGSSPSSHVGNPRDMHGSGCHASSGNDAGFHGYSFGFACL
jgi:hypothetical protein